MNNPEGRGERPARTLGTKKICIIRDTLSNDKKKRSGFVAFVRAIRRLEGELDTSPLLVYEQGNGAVDEQDSSEMR